MCKVKKQRVSKLGIDYFSEYHEHFEDSDFVFIVFSLCNDGDLKKYIENNKEQMTVRRCLEIIFQIASGVRILHEEGITHRDLKPGNVLIHEGKIKITDFGLAMDQINMESEVGTLLYMAPEIISLSVDKYCNKVDIWSLGVILFMMLTEQFPFIDLTKKQIKRKILTEEYKTPKRFKKIWTRDLKNLLKKCFEKNPEERPCINEFIDNPVFEEFKTTLNISLEAQEKTITPKRKCDEKICQGN